MDDEINKAEEFLKCFNVVIEDFPKIMEAYHQSRVNVFKNDLQKIINNDCVEYCQLDEIKQILKQ